MCPWNLKPGNAISCILSIQICSKIYANYICNKKLKNINHNLSPLIRGDSNGQRSRVWEHTPAENFWNLKPGNAVSCILSIQICSVEFMLTILVFEIKEGKTRKKLKNINHIIYHYLLGGDSNGQRSRVSPRTFLKFEARKCRVSCILSIQICSVEFMLTILVFIKEGKTHKK
jgi:hypothetical protein